MRNNKISLSDVIVMTRWQNKICINNFWCPASGVFPTNEHVLGENIYAFLKTQNITSMTINIAFIAESKRLSGMTCKLTLGH